MRSLWQLAARNGPEPCVICLRPADTRHHIAPHPEPGPVVPLCFACHQECEARFLTILGRDFSRDDIQPPNLFASVRHEQRTGSEALTPMPVMERYLRIVRASLKRRRKAAREDALAKVGALDWEEVFQKIRSDLELLRHPILLDHRIAPLGGRTSRRVKEKNYPLGDQCEMCGAPESSLCGIYPRSCLSAVRGEGGHVDHQKTGNPFRVLCSGCLRKWLGATWPKLSRDFWKAYLGVRAPDRRRPYRVRLAKTLLERDTVDAGLAREALAWGLDGKKTALLRRYIRRCSLKPEDYSGDLARRFQAEMHLFRGRKGVTP